jgi:hypothetical protein
MSYQVSRNGQLYGPYTLEDLQRYVASGNVLATDLARDTALPEETAPWIPVSQLLGAAGAAIPAPPEAIPPGYGATAAYAGPVTLYPDPPNLHWGLCLLFGFLTCGIFTIIYDVIQTIWLKKVNPASKSLLYYIIFMGLEFLNFGGSMGKAALIMRGQIPPVTGSSIMFSLLSGVISIAVLVMFIVYRFTMRSELQYHFNGPEPIGLRLGGFMTFFFGGLYFQYHFNRINEIKQGLRYRGTLV